MLLYLKKMEIDTENAGDLENCRLRVEFIDKKGRRVVGDIGENCGSAPGMIHPHWCYECHNGTFDYFKREGYKTAWQFPFTKAGALQLVNRFSAIRYAGVEIVNDPPEVQYPEEVLQLERDYKERERRAGYEVLLQSIREAPVKWRWLRSWQIENLTPDEFKELTLTAAKSWIDGMREKGPLAWDKFAPEIRAKRIASVFADLHKAGNPNLYSESCPINPLHDLEFMAQLIEIDPAFAYPAKEYTPEEFAHLVTG